MQAISFTRYGSPDALRLVEVAKPVPEDDEVLVKVHATTVNRTDCATLRAIPFFMRIVTGLFKPKKQIPGTEFAGEVMAVGKNINSLRVGDKVFGFDDMGASCQAQYTTVQPNRLTSIPGDISYAQAAVSTEGAHYAINFINKVEIKPGQNVLVNGATGAIGSATVQLLRYYDAEVTAVCAGEHVALVKSLGAGKVIDYQTEDFTLDEQEYDLVFDAVGKSSFFKCKQLLRKGGIYISSDLGFMAQNIFLPLLTPIVKPLLGNKKTVFPMPENIPESLALIRDLMQQDKFRAVIDKSFALEEIVEAYKYVETGQKTGNVVITVAHDD